LFVANALVFKKRREKCLFYQELERVLQQVKTADFQRIYEMISSNSLYDLSILMIQATRTVFNKHIKMAILPRIKIHNIRHINNTWLLDENQSIFAADIITKRLGRSSLKVILDNYYHSNPAVEESIVEKIKI